MKKIAVVLLLTLVTAQVFASSGRTNSQGCHNSQTEGYLMWIYDFRPRL